MADTTAKLGDQAKQYQANQTGLRDYLGQAANKYDGQLGTAVQGAKDQFNQELKQPGTAYGTWSQSPYTREQIRNNFFNAAGAADQFGAKRVDGKQGLAPTVQNYMYKDPNNEINRMVVDANNWMFDQGARFDGVGDTEKRSYNTIQDFLNTNGAKKTRGFDVRK